jgi:hypothetical protein
MTLRTSHVLAATAAAAMLITGAAGAASSSRSDLHSRTLNPTKTKIEGYTGSKTATLSARITVPRSWSVVTAKPSVQTYREGSASCRYIVRVRTKLVVTSSDALGYARSAAPATGAYVLDEGTRGRAAWRVTRLNNSATTSLKAVGVYPRSLGSSGGDVVGSGHAFQIITFDAAAAANSECHSGTYREVLGPQIGDALAIAKTRAYIDLQR